MSTRGSAKKPSIRKPANQGSSSGTHIQQPIKGGTNADRPPKPAKNVNTSIVKPGHGTGGDGKTARKPKAF
jgi:hypothetical protein